MQIKFEAFASMETHPDAVSKGIVAVTKEKASHVGIVVTLPGGERKIYHATGKGFHHMPEKDFLSNHVYVGLKEIPVRDESFALGWLEGNCGKDYSETQYFGFLLRKLKKFVDDDNRELICSEAVYLFAKTCAIYNLPEVDADFLTPMQAFDMLPGFDQVLTHKI